MPATNSHIATFVVGATVAAAAIETVWNFTGVLGASSGSAGNGFLMLANPSRRLAARPTCT